MKEGVMYHISLTIYLHNIKYISYNVMSSTARFHHVTIGVLWKPMLSIFKRLK